MKVSVPGKDLEILETFKLRERIVGFAAHLQSQSGVHFRCQSMPALTLESFEVGLDLDLDLMTVAEILEKLPTASTRREAASSAYLQPSRIRNGFALPTVRTARQLLS